MSSEYLSRLANRAEVEILNAAVHLRQAGWPDHVITSILRHCRGLGATADHNARLPERLGAYFESMRERWGDGFGLSDPHWELVLVGVKTNAQTAKSIVDLCEYYWMGSPYVEEIYG